MLMNNEVMKKLGWFMVRLVIAYLSIGVLLGVVILNNTYAPRFFFNELGHYGVVCRLGDHTKLCTISDKEDD